MLGRLTHEDFIEAIETGDLNSVQEYLAVNADNPDALNVVGENGLTALMLAIDLYLNQIALAILDAQGILVNMRDSRGRTALLHATGGDDDIRILNTLLAYPGIEVNAQDNEGYTALMNAVNDSFVSKVAVLLLDERVDITVINNFGQTAINMHPYNARRHQIIVRMFADREYAREVLNSLGLGVAAQPINLQPEPAVTAAAYLQAVINGDIDMVQRYLADNAGDVNAINVRNEATMRRGLSGGMTPLMIALYLGNIDIARELIGTPGIDVNAIHETDQRTTLMFAVTCTFYVSALLELPHININAQDIMGQTALMLALETMSEYHIAALLLHPGIDLTLRNNDGQTAMDILAEFERYLPVYGSHLPATVIAQTQERFERVRQMFNDRAYARRLLDRLEELIIVEQSTNPLFELMQGNTGREVLLRILEAQPPTPEQLQARVGQGLMRESFINAVNSGNREAIEEFIRHNNGHPAMFALGQEAALIAQRNERDDLAVVITQLIINDVQGQSANAEPSPVDELDQVDPNSFEGRLDAIGFDSANIPPRFRDPVHQGIMEYPMVLKGGQTIDRPSLEDLIKLKLPNPFTREPIDDSELERSVSYDLKAFIEAFVVEQEMKYKLEQERIAAANREVAAPPPQENLVEESPEFSDRERAIQARWRQFGTPADQERRDDATSLSSKRNLTGKE